mmetsp:Transcript_24382/g.79491  ORF Transcript_24382/g.79491 Transcript_24382/m.79491 type:complete len:218 (+) Transcript_24382:1790-2443(+)
MRYLFPREGITIFWLPLSSPPTRALGLHGRAPAPARVRGWRCAGSKPGPCPTTSCVWNSLARPTYPTPYPTPSCVWRGLPHPTSTSPSAGLLCLWRRARPLHRVRRRPPPPHAARARGGGHARGRSGPRRPRRQRQRRQHLGQPLRAVAPRKAARLPADQPRRHALPLAPRRAGLGPPPPRLARPAAAARRSAIGRRRAAPAARGRGRVAARATRWR